MQIPNYFVDDCRWRTFLKLLQKRSTKKKPFIYLSVMFIIILFVYVCLFKSGGSHVFFLTSTPYVSSCFKEAVPLCPPALTYLH